MKFKMIHNNLNVFDLQKSMQFYEDAFGLTEHHRITAPDGSFTIIYLKDPLGQHLLELTWLRDRKEPYNLGDNEFHLAFETENYEEAFQKHSEMGIVCFENTAMGIYFVSDPDGYWLEVLPANR